MPSCMACKSSDAVKNTSLISKKEKRSGSSFVVASSAVVVNQRCDIIYPFRELGKKRGDAQRK
jgi:hypothetical protein